VIVDANVSLILGQTAYLKRINVVSSLFTVVISKLTSLVNMLLKVLFLVGYLMTHTSGRFRIFHIFLKTISHHWLTTTNYSTAVQSASTSVKGAPSFCVALGVYTRHYGKS